MRVRLELVGAEVARLSGAVAAAKRIGETHG